MTITDGVESAIVAHARAASPAECCGLLLGTDNAILEAVAATNIADDPARRFLVDPHDHLRAIRSARARGLSVVGAYHSHPRSGAEPSPTDRSEAFEEFVWVIIGLGADLAEIRAWRWTNGNFVPVPLVRVREGEG